MKKIQYYPLIDMANQHLFDEGGITSSNGMYYVNPSDYQSILDAQSNNQPVNVTLPDVIVKAVDPKNYRSAFHPEDISTITDVMMGPFKLFLTNPFKLTQSIVNKDYSTTGEEVLKTILPMENVLGHTANFALGVDQLLNENGVRKTYNHLKKGEYGRAALSGLGDIFNAAMTGLGAKGLYGDLQNGYTKFMEGEVPQWLRNTSLWHNATAEHRAKRALDTSEELRHQFINNYKTEDRAANFALPALKEKIVIKSGKNTPNPINVEKMTPKAVKETWDKIASNQWYGRPEIVIKDIDGKPTAVSHVGGYSPTQMINGRPRVTTGKYSIPDFATGDIVNGDLQIKGGSTESLITQYGDIINNEGVPREVTGLTPLQEVLRDNYNYVQKDLPGFRGFGSSIGVMDGSLSHITHDIDGFMTKEAYDAARKVHPDITTPDSRGLASYFVKPEQYGNDINGANHIDINVIDVNPTTGLGNSRATELYRQFFPREYRQSVINVAKRSNDTSQIPIVHLDGTPFTNQELLEAYDPLRKTIMDSMESSKGKHIGRMMEYLAGPNPDAVHDAIQATADEIAQVDKGFTLPKLKLGTPKENAAILKKIGFNGDIATVAADPKKMQNTLDLWYMGEGGYFSRTASAGDRGETGGTINKLFRNFTDWNEKTDSSSNGHGAGAFLNAVFGNTHSVIGNSVYGVYHPKLQGIKEGITPDELISTVRRQNGWSTEKVTKEDLTKIVKALRDNNLNTAADNIENTFKSGKDVTFNDLLNTLPNYGSEVKNAGKQIHAETGINAIGGEPYNNEARYAGLIGSFDPNTDIGFFGRDNFEGWPSWSERNISEVASDSNPFKAMKEHTTYDEGESFMRSPNYVDISKEQFDKYFDMIHRDDLKNYAFRYILRQHPELQGKVTIDEVMKLPEFREYILKFNTPELRKTSATDMFGFSQDASSKTGYQVNLKELRSTIRNNKRKEHNRKATDWSKKALVEEQRNNRIYTKMKSIDENKSSIKKGAVYAGIAGAVSTGSYGLYSNYKKSEEDSALFKKWLETSEGQDYSSKLIELHRNKASDEELEKLYNDKDRAFEKFKVLMNIKNHTHAKGGFLGNTLPEVEVVAKYPHEQRVIDTMNASNAEFMQRLRNNDLRAIHNADGSYSTHVLGNADNMVFPAIQDVNGVLEDYRNLPWQRTLDRAIQNKDYIEFPTEGDARYFGEHYKKYFPEFFSHFGDNQYAEGGEIEKPKHWKELSMADKSDAIASAVRNGVTTLEDIRKAWDDYADSGYREDSSYRDNSEDMGNTFDDYDDTYQEETHEYLKGGYKPSASIKNRIANWEGSSMQTNRSFAAEAKDFWNAIPSNVRSKLSQQQADALYSYSYNVGAGNFKKRVVPSLERYFNGNGSVEDVQRHMYATKDKDLRGLAKRRAVERAMFGGQRVEDVPSFDYDYSSNSSPYGHRFTVNNNFQTAGYLGPIVNGNSVNNDNTNKTNIFLQALEDEPKQTIAESTPEPRYNALERLQNIYSMYGMDDYAQEIGKYNPFEGLMFAEGGKKSTDTKGVTSSNGQYHVNPTNYWAVLGSVKNNRPVEVTLPDVTVKAADPKNYRSSYDPNGFMDFMNAVTLGVGNRFSVSQDARLLKDTYDAISGNKSWKDVFNSAVFGRMNEPKGTVTENRKAVESAKSKYPMLDNLDFSVYSDPNYRASDYDDYGDIEVFHKGEQKIDYTPEYSYPNPNIDQDNVLYNPNRIPERYTQDAINLDAISHLGHNDPTYDTLNAAIGSEYPDAATNEMLPLYEKMTGKNLMKMPDSKKPLKKEWIPQVLKAWDDAPQRYQNAIDGLVRDYIISKEHPDPNDPIYKRLNYVKYNPQWDSENNSPFYLNQLYDYITTGRRPANILPEVIVTGHKHEGG